MSYRIFLPEFRAGLLAASQEKKEKPSLDGEVQAGIEQRINAALATGDIVRVMIYTDQGIEERVGVITAVSMATREIKIAIAGGRVRVRLDDVVGVEGENKNNGPVPRCS